LSKETNIRIKDRERQRNKHTIFINTEWKNAKRHAKRERVKKAPIRESDD
jgi:hypothetical protein